MDNCGEIIDEMGSGAESPVAGLGRLWICGKLNGEWDDEMTPWTLKGVFFTHERAVACCKDEKYFIFPVISDKEYLETEIMTEATVIFPVIEADFQA